MGAFVCPNCGNPCTNINISSTPSSYKRVTMFCEPCDAKVSMLIEEDSLEC